MTNDFIAYNIEPTIANCNDGWDFEAVANLAKKLDHCHFHHGASRLCLVFDNDDEVIKIPYMSETSTDYCALELKNYERAKDFGIEEILLPIRKYGEYENGLSIYVQTKYGFSSLGAKREWLQQKRQSTTFQRIVATKNFRRLLNSCYKSMISYEWFMFVYAYYGKDFCKRFAEWTHDCKVNDLHFGNTGFLHGRPILLDYAGYFG